jgi:hypothetical protein
MAEAEKGPTVDKSGRKRLIYLRTRFKELREEMQTIKKETADLKAKLGMGAKGGTGEGGAKKGGGGNKKKSAEMDDDE